MRPSLRGGSGGRLVPLRGPDSSMPRGPACRIGVAAAVGRSAPSTPRRVVRACGTAQAATARALSVRDRKWAGSARAASLVARSRSASAVNSVSRLPESTTTPSRARARRGRRGRRARRSLLDWRGHPVSPAMSQGVHRAVVQEGVHAGSLARLGLHSLQYASRAVASSSWTSCSRRKRVRIDVNHCYFVVVCLSVAHAVVRWSGATVRTLGVETPPSPRDWRSDE